MNPGWRQGVLTLAEALSVDKAKNGWFIPNCDEMPALLNAANADMRRTVRVPQLEDLETRANVLQVFNKVRDSISSKLLGVLETLSFYFLFRRSTTG